ncbi:MAG: RNA polymerase sigma factor [Actinomycetota bacterium]
MEQDFDAFCRREYEGVFRASYALAGDRQLAEDATQEAFGRAFARWARLSSEAWAAGWVMTTALNVCRRHHRMERRIWRFWSPESKQTVSAVERTDVVAALRTLPPRQRQAVILHYLGDLPVQQVADLMNTTDGTIKAYLFRGRAALREALGGPTQASRQEAVNEH